MQPTRASLAFVILMATLAVVAGSSGNSDGANGETAIEKPAHRTTSFVPRLGKREPQATALDRLKIDRFLCANYGLDCGRSLEELSRATTLDAAPTASDQLGSRLAPNGPLMALLSSLTTALQDSKPVAAAATSQPDVDSLRQAVDEATLLELLGQRLGNSAARETRGSSGELFDVSPFAMGAKRVAFTPRIGR